MTKRAFPHITEAHASDAAAIATIHLSARKHAMPDLRRVYTDAKTRAYFAQVVADRPGAWWVVRLPVSVAAYMRIDGETLDHLYVLPRWHRRGLGSALIEHAKALSPGHLSLWTFQRNLAAQAFYEACGFIGTNQTDGDNEEGEPDTLYEWTPA